MQKAKGPQVGLCTQALQGTTLQRGLRCRGWDAEGKRNLRPLAVAGKKGWPGPSRGAWEQLVPSSAAGAEAAVAATAAVAGAAAAADTAAAA